MRKRCLRYLEEKLLRPGETMTTKTVPSAQLGTRESHLVLEPSWTWLQKDAPERAWDTAFLFEHRILDRWFYLDRETGEIIWHNRETLPNLIFHVRDGGHRHRPTFLSPVGQ